MKAGGNVETGFQFMVIYADIAYKAIVCCFQKRSQVNDERGEAEQKYGQAKIKQ